MQQLALTRLCHFQSLQDLPKIWTDLAPLKKEKARTVLEIACLARVWALRIKLPKITHMVAFLILGVAFHTEDPNGESDAVNIFMFPDLYLAAGTKAALVARRWETSLDSNTLTYYSDTAALMTKQRISPIMVWEGEANIIKQWLVFLDAIIGPPELHLEVYKLSTLFNGTEEVSTRLHAQSHQQPYIPAALILIVQTEFNESLRQVFVIPLPVYVHTLRP